MPYTLRLQQSPQKVKEDKECGIKLCLPQLIKEFHVLLSD